MTATATGRKLIVRVENDPDVECPLEYGHWKLYSFNRRSIHYKNPEIFFRRSEEGKIVPENIGLQRKMQVGLAFALQYYEHGSGRYDLQGHGPQCEWDTAQWGGILIWEGKPKDMPFKTYEERQNSAELTLDEYNDWMNGNTFWFSIETHDYPDDGHHESCGGFIGEKSVIEEINSRLNKDDKILLTGESAFMVQGDLKGEEVDSFDDENEDD